MSDDKLSDLAAAAQRRRNGDPMATFARSVIGSAEPRGIALPDATPEPTDDEPLRDFVRDMFHRTDREDR